MRVGKHNIERSDQYNVTITDITINQKTGEEYLSNARYHSTWEGALTRCIELNIVSTEVKDMLNEIRVAKEEIIKEIQKLKKLP